MDCLNFLCIYQRGDKCTLDKIGISETGNCEECVYPYIASDYLEYEKEKLRKQFEKESNKSD